jgi:hypothetical protein
MTIVRALRSAMAACWAACGSVIDLQDCVIILALVMIGIGCWWVTPSLGLIVPGGLLFISATWPGPKPPSREVTR